MYTSNLKGQNISAKYCLWNISDELVYNYSYLDWENFFFCILKLGRLFATCKQYYCILLFY